MAEEAVLGLNGSCGNLTVAVPGVGLASLPRGPRDRGEQKCWDETWSGYVVDMVVVAVAVV